MEEGALWVWMGWDGPEPALFLLGFLCSAIASRWPEGSLVGPAEFVGETSLGLTV